MTVFFTIDGHTSLLSVSTPGGPLTRAKGGSLNVNLFHFVMTGGLGPSRGRDAPCLAQMQDNLIYKENANTSNVTSFSASKSTSDHMQKHARKLGQSACRACLPSRQLRQSSLYRKSSSISSIWTVGICDLFDVS